MIVYPFEFSSDVSHIGHGLDHPKMVSPSSITSSCSFIIFFLAPSMHKLSIAAPSLSQNASAQVCKKLCCCARIASDCFLIRHLVLIPDQPKNPSLCLTFGQSDCFLIIRFAIFSSTLSFFFGLVRKSAPIITQKSNAAAISQKVGFLKFRIPFTLCFTPTSPNANGQTVIIFPGTWNESRTSEYSFSALRSSPLSHAHRMPSQCPGKTKCTPASRTD